MTNRFDLEQAILNLGSITEDLDLVSSKADEMNIDEMQNALIGLKTIYGLRFDVLWDTFEEYVYTLPESKRYRDLMEDLNANNN